MNREDSEKGSHLKRIRRWWYAKIRKMMKPHPAPAVRPRLQPHNKT